MHMMFKLLCFCILFSATSVRAHEVWLEMSDWSLSPQQDFSARLINGHEFEGIELSWHPRSILRAEMWRGTEGFELVGRAGDRPVIRSRAGGDSLLILIYQPTHSTLVYDTFDKFASFARQKGQDQAIADHADRGLPQQAIREAYTRFVKVLAGVGSATGTDRSFGMELEIVALDNPYVANLSAPLRFRVLYRDAPLTDNQVMLLARDDTGAVSKTLEQTDEAGLVSFPVEPGVTYLVDSVVLRAPDAELAARTQGAVWESLWASLTFRVPAKDQ